MESFISSPNFANRFEFKCCTTPPWHYLDFVPQLTPVSPPGPTRDKAELCGKIYFCAIAKWNFHLNGGGNSIRLSIFWGHLCVQRNYYSLRLPPKKPNRL